MRSFSIATAPGAAGSCSSKISSSAPSSRGKGIATSLLAQVAEIAVSENCRAVRWEVLEWNQAALNLYTSIGTTFLDDYRIVLLKDDALRKLAAKAG